MELTSTFRVPESNDETRREFGCFVRQARRNVGLTQQQLASRTGLNNASFIAAIEAGKSRLPVERTELFAEALEMSERALVWEAIKGWDMNLFMSLFWPDREGEQS